MKVSRLTLGLIRAPPGPSNKLRDEISFGSRHNTGVPAGVAFFFSDFS
jgi:hypothetical protein